MGLANMDRRLEAASQITALHILLLLAAAALCESNASFGFDAANSCSPNGKLTRRGRAQMLAAIPCDLSKQAFCHLPGSAYPWHAVRRFVHENQGLMKRMYGDVRHISILRDEIQNNEVEVDDVQPANKDGRRAAKYMIHSRDEYKGSSNDVLMEPHFRPVSTVAPPTAAAASGTSSTSTTTRTTTAGAPVETTASSSSSNASSTTAPTPQSNAAELEQELERPNMESNSVYEPITTTPAPVQGENIKIIDSPQLGLRNLSAEAAPTVTSTTLPTPTKRNTLTHQRPQETERVTPAAVTNSVKSASASMLTSTTKLSTAAAMSSSSSSVVPAFALRNATFGAQGTNAALTTPVTFAALFAATSSAVRRPVTNFTAPAAAGLAGQAGSGTKPVLRDGQLFQDAMKQDPVQVNSNMRGVNACPVKDEVVAPFWANNTRGEVLALLNLYPFEQYVHWEKCTHEFKQMFCRDGCRCEQQYRLHRLLAYDPHNECRGIFSDWFRFPSSCICKCYNIPLDFRATSRSPRSDSSFDAPYAPANPPNPIDAAEAAEAEVQRAIYEHATEQWYRPRDEFDFF